LCAHKEAVIVQQANAQPRHATDRSAVKAAAAAGGRAITFANEPPRSLDINVLDLGWFNAQQSLQYENQSRDVDGLIGALSKAFEEMDSSTTNK